MIDLRRLRDEPEYRAGIERKRVAPGLIVEVLGVDAELRAQQRVVEDLRARQKAVSKEISRDPVDRDAKLAEASTLKEAGQQAEEQLGILERRRRDLAVQLPNPAERLAWLAETVPKLPGTGIVYTLTVEDARRVTGWLRGHGIDARAYFGDESTETKVEIERQLQANELKCVVATSALGMGYDKPDLAFVVHFQVPGSAVAYYQQVGRAGRPRQA